MIWHAWIYGGRIQRLRDGKTLTKTELDGLFAHLRRCERCRRSYDLAMGTDRLLASKGTTASVPPMAVIEALAARVMPGEAASKRPMPWLVPVLASAAALVLVTVVLVQKQTPDEFTPRQGEDAPFVVKVFCDQPPAAPIALDQTPDNRCAAGSMYRFAYTAKAPCEVEMTSSVGGEKTSLGPAQTLPATKVLRPLGSAMTLAPNVDRVDVSCRQGQSVQVVTVRIGAKR